jgi:hypothetical protein
MMRNCLLSLEALWEGSPFAEFREWGPLYQLSGTAKSGEGASRPPQLG